ncbi:unnamed protein product [Penicillium egyptiacum]|uniref:Uncharacterized protein n=1 Tax=Penicillium egyptiacum TaxID=1303716 RepID=A0A9W4P3R7_9EURO|nr:unnamed protein product [Penicillium egyptiacum]
MIIGTLVFIVFVLIEKRASHPLIPFGVLRIDSLFTLAYISAGWSSFSIFVFYTLNLLEVLREQTPLLTSAQMMPIAIRAICYGHHGHTSKQLPRVDSHADLYDLLPYRGCYLRDDACGPDLLGADVRGDHCPSIGHGFVGLATSLVTTFINYSISIGLSFAGTIES